jgi:hypothetical protein
MTTQQLQNWNEQAINGTISDELNPAFIFSTTASDLLSQIAKGEINAQELAKRILESRGQDINGHWVGFNKTIK